MATRIARICTTSVHSALMGRCVASGGASVMAARSYRRSSSLSARYLSWTVSKRFFFHPRRSIPGGPSLVYSIRSFATESSTIHGTIGKGASGVGNDAQLVKDRLRAPDHLDEKERLIFEKLEAELDPESLEVQDISGGCGSMYGIDIVSERFRGMSMLKQQRLVNKVLGEEIKGWHGVQLKTKAP